jgi:hypothetical protein
MSIATLLQLGGYREVLPLFVLGVAQTLGLSGAEHDTFTMIPKGLWVRLRERTRERPALV